MPSLNGFFGNVQWLLPKKSSSEIVWAADGCVHRASGSVPDQTQKETVLCPTSTTGGEADISNFIQNSIHQMSEIEGEADVNLLRRDFR